MSIYENIDLKLFGFTENENYLYKNGLRLGTSTVSRLAKISGMHRVGAYNTLQEMVKKGYVQCTMKGNTGYYTMTSPNMIKEKLIDRVERFGNIQPLLESLVHKTSSAFEVQVFEGYEGVCQLYTLLLASKTSLRSFLGIDHMDESIKDWLYSSYLPRRIKKGISNKSILTDTAENRYFADEEHVSLTQARILKNDMFSLQCEIVLFDHEKILISSLSPDELSGILISSKNLYASFEGIFEVLWTVAEE